MKSAESSWLLDIAFQTYGADELTDLFKMFDDDVEDDDDDEDVQSFSVGNAYLDEKEDALVSLGEVALSTG